MQNPGNQTSKQASPVPALMFAVSVVGSNGLALSPILTDVAQSFSTSALTISTAISAYGAATAASAFFLAVASTASASAVRCWAQCWC